MNKVKKGFTLAEVLLTLTVIGIVAAMTIPALIANTSKQQYVVSLKKFYSVFSQGLTKYMADKGCIGNVDCALNSSTTESHDFSEATMTDFITKTFNTTRICPSGTTNCVVVQGNYLGIGGQPILAMSTFNGITSVPQHGSTTTQFGFILTDGTLVEFDPFGEISVDVNGTKKPNQAGRDLFFFQIGDASGQLLPWGGMGYAQYYYEDYKNSQLYWGNSSPLVPIDCNPSHSNADGLGCTGRVIDQSWEMNY